MAIGDDGAKTNAQLLRLARLSFAHEHPTLPHGSTSNDNFDTTV